MSAFDILYPYQKDIVKVTQDTNKGIVCIPTGTGKTFVQASIVADDIEKNPNQFRVYVINVPRILLSFQIFKEVYTFLTSSGFEARYMFVHSGGKTDEKEIEEIRLEANDQGYAIPFSEIGSGTSIDGIRQMIDKARAQNLPLVFFSTYNSAQNIQIAMNSYHEGISIVLSDEAHYLVQEQFHDILGTLRSPRSYFFTATTIHTPSDTGRGMNNIESYGPLLYTMTPRVAIDMGKMVRPRMHFVNTDGVYTTDDYEKSLSKIIYESFHQHEAVLTKLKGKILISVKGTQDIQKFLASQEYTTLRREGVNIYAIATREEIGNDINGEKVRRPEFLRRLKEAGKDKKKRLIVLHYDTMAEGIDVSGFTGILPLRSLQKSKFLQTFGRAARLDEDDRKRLQSGKLKVEDFATKFNKPYAYIIVPNVVHSNFDDAENFRKLITELRDYGFNPFEDIISSTRINGMIDIDEPNGVNDLLTRLPNVGELIENLEAELENEADAKLSKPEFLNKTISKRVENRKVKEPKIVITEKEIEVGCSCTDEVEEPKPKNSFLGFLKNLLKD